jgi:DNA modification methylase
MHKLINGDCLKILPTLSPVKCIFADPPDNIGLAYSGFDDKADPTAYVEWLYKVVKACITTADITWISFNAKWTVAMGQIVGDLTRVRPKLLVKPCVQVYTFGQHRHTDMGNGHRPLWRLMWEGTPIYPDQIREPSWRQLNGDKRADPRGRVPDDVFRHERVTGNSKQRRAYHPTQLNEALVERCIRLSTRELERVIDPFAGTGTTLRVCKRLNRPCTSIEVSDVYCEKIAEEHGLEIIQ